MITDSQLDAWDADARSASSMTWVYHNGDQLPLAEFAALEAAVPRLTAEVRRLRAEAAALWDEAKQARTMAYGAGCRWAGDVPQHPDNPYRPQGEGHA